MIDLVVREATVADAAGIVGVFNPIIESGLYTAILTPFSVEEEEQYIRNLPERAVLHVAVQSPEERVVGFQGLQPFPAHTSAWAHIGIMGTFVDEALRRRGVSKRLFAATLRAAPARGYEKILTYVRADNPEALFAYQAQGFHGCGGLDAAYETGRPICRRNNHREAARLGPAVQTVDWSPYYTAPHHRMACRVWAAAA